jgi:pyridoxal phosphate enzyme (YggS family)
MQMKNSVEQIIKDNYLRLQDDITGTITRCNRQLSGISTVLVTKYQPVQKINAAIEAGGCHFAENYPEMLIPKLQDNNATASIKWHMIGHIQSRKANLVMDHFDYVHSIDSLKIAQRLQRRGEETDRRQIVLVEVNLGQEESKNGYRVGNAEEYGIFISDVLEISKLSKLSIKGLMTMPPITNDGEESRKYFSDLRQLLEKVNNEIANLHLSELSMGTSQDYKIAIEEGATMLRIGTFVFGERQWQ